MDNGTQLSQRFNGMARTKATQRHFSVYSRGKPSLGKPLQVSRKDYYQYQHQKCDLVYASSAPCDPMRHEVAVDSPFESSSSATPPSLRHAATPPSYNIFSTFESIARDVESLPSVPSETLGSWNQTTDPLHPDFVVVDNGAAEPEVPKPVHNSVRKKGRKPKGEKKPPGSATSVSRGNKTLVDPGYERAQQSWRKKRTWDELGPLISNMVKQRKHEPSELKTVHACESHNLKQEIDQTDNEEDRWLVPVDCMHTGPVPAAIDLRGLLTPIEPVAEAPRPRGRPKGSKNSNNIESPKTKKDPLRPLSPPFEDPAPKRVRNVSFVTPEVQPCFLNLNTIDPPMYAWLTHSQKSPQERRELQIKHLLRDHPSVYDQVVKAEADVASKTMESPNPTVSDSATALISMAPITSSIDSAHPAAFIIFPQNEANAPPHAPTPPSVEGFIPISGVPVSNNANNANNEGFIPISGVPVSNNRVIPNGHDIQIAQPKPSFVVPDVITSKATHLDNTQIGMEVTSPVPSTRDADAQDLADSPSLSSNGSGSLGNASTKACNNSAAPGKKEPLNYLNCLCPHLT